MMSGSYGESVIISASGSSGERLFLLMSDSYGESVMTSSSYGECFMTSGSYGGSSGERLVLFLNLSGVHRLELIFYHSTMVFNE